MDDLKDIKVDVSNIDLTNENKHVLSENEKQVILNQSANFVFGKSEVKQALGELALL
ncbi:hypothetical protein [Lentilactobacillus hilgardii]|uniref:hypothetical protein n=1 Tax=Lentilactobacillus hilgardii TaxID=1588 RepID=UPI0021A6AE4A|nr:hypothetical protein [Lentilactobacillus hilgardii]